MRLAQPWRGAVNVALVILILCIILGAVILSILWAVFVVRTVVS